MAKIKPGSGAGQRQRIATHNEIWRKSVTIFSPLAFFFSLFFMVSGQGCMLALLLLLRNIAIIPLLPFSRESKYAKDNGKVFPPSPFH